MKLIGLEQVLETRVAEVLEKFKVTECLDEIYISQLKPESEYCIEIERGETCFIKYKKKHHLFRALGLYIQLSNDFKVNFIRKEKETFKTCGPMIDASRNAIYKVSTLKSLLLDCALMGLNQCMIYTEDTYEIEGLPYFGYLRGRYGKEELKAVDDYADSLGIELIPCIQTLAHLNQTLRWNYAKDVIDIDDILLVGEEKTYKLIGQMLETLRGIFRSKRIHIGMDEAYALGRGRYIDQRGYKEQFEIMLEHLERVVKLAKEYDFTPMIWDDMFQRSPETGYDTQREIDPKVVKAVPKDLEMVYWDYYSVDVAHYENALGRRKAFNKPVIFAGGIWRWGGILPNYEKTMGTTTASLKACKTYGVEEVIATAWGDDGSEVPLRTIMLGLILFAESNYDRADDEKWLDERCLFLTGLNSQDFMDMEKIDLIPMIERPNYKVVNLSKAFLYQDILLGAFDKHAEDLELKQHYIDCAHLYKKLAQKTEDYSYIFEMYEKLSLVLAYKYNLGVRLRKAYLQQDKLALKELLDTTFKTLEEHLEEYHQSVRNTWLKESKGQGLEVLDIRIGGIAARLKTAALRIQDYIDGEIEQIEELDEKRLIFDRHIGGQFAHQNQYALIATQNVFTHNFMAL